MAVIKVFALSVACLTVPAYATAIAATPIAVLSGLIATADDSQQMADSTEGNADGKDVRIPPERLDWHIPDPSDIDEMAALWLERAESNQDDTAKKATARVRDIFQSTKRQKQVHMSLEDALHRALANSYSIEVESYNPPISMTAVVAAEAAFDAVFFANITKNKVDRPTGSQLQSTDLDAFSSSFGVAKSLPVGSRITTSYGLNRQKTTLSFQEINPEYFSNFVVQLDQPLLRGFGLDNGLAEIRVSKKQKSISDLAFQIAVRDTLKSIEELYWSLVFARRDLVITTRLVMENEEIYKFLVARKDFDVTPVEIERSLANLQDSRLQLLQRKRSARDAEDNLIASMNDPELNLIDGVEIVPTDFPKLDYVAIDRFAEVKEALAKNPELKQLELQIGINEIRVGQAHNAELPQLDLTFRYTVDGLAGTADRSFDKLTGNNFIEYFVGVNLNVPIGNRGPRASSRSARLAHSQAVSSLKNGMERLILAVNTAVRDVGTAYQAIPTALVGSEANERQVESIVARAERKDINTLNSELGARQTLVNSRRVMLQAMVDYNLSLVRLEQAKGTLLNYYNVVIPDQAGEE